MRRFLQDKGRTSKPQLWEIVPKGRTVVIRWGQLGGKMQVTVQKFSKPLNKGKKNEKSAEVQALEYADREITMRIRKGYREVDDNDQYLEEASSKEINFIRLPENLRFFKPQNSVNAYCQKLLDSKRAWLLRKRDGMMHVVSTGEDGHPRIYSSTMQINHKDEPGLPFSDRFPHLMEGFSKMNMPPKTILLGEIVTCAAAGYLDNHSMSTDDFEYVGSILKSKTPLALKKQEEGGQLGYCIWDIGFWDGQCWLVSAKAEDRFNFIHELVKNSGPWISMPEIVKLDDEGFKVESVDAGATFEVEYDDPDDVAADLLEFAKERSWEGYVVVDPSSCYGEKAYSFHGKPERPKFISKMKPKYEADFIVRWDPDNGIGKRGKGKKSVGVGSVMAYLWDPKTRKEVKISLVGGGFSDKDVKRFAKPSLYPTVFQVEFDSMTSKGSLRFPEFVRERPDKNMKECTFDQIPKKFLEKLENAV